MKIEIYQTKHDLPDEEEFSFMDYDFASRKIKDFARNWRKYYNFVYNYELDGKQSDAVILEECFERFNINRPDDYKGRSLSVSDIVIIDDTPYYCDPFGWLEVN